MHGPEPERDVTKDDFRNRLCEKADAVNNLDNIEIILNKWDVGLNILTSCGK